MFVPMTLRPNEVSFILVKNTLKEKIDALKQQSRVQYPKEQKDEDMEEIGKILNDEEDVLISQSETTSLAATGFSREGEVLFQYRNEE